MDIQKMIDELNEKLKEETIRMNEQKIIVEELGNKYSEQCAILKVIKKNVRNLDDSIAELKRNLVPGKDAKPTKMVTDQFLGEEDEQFARITTLLNEAVDIAVREGLIREEIMTKNGNTCNMRRSIINRARNSIIRYCRSPYPVEWLLTATDKDICGLRNAGTKTQEVIKTARSILKGEAVC